MRTPRPVPNIPNPPSVPPVRPVPSVVLRVSDKQLTEQLVAMFRERWSGAEDTFLSTCLDFIEAMRVVNRDNVFEWHKHTDHHDHIKRAVDALCELLPNLTREQVEGRVKHLITVAYGDVTDPCASCDFHNEGGTDGKSK